MYTAKIYDDDTDLVINEDMFFTYNEAINWAEAETDIDTQYYIIKET